MIKTGGNETNDLVVTVNESFWVMFFSGRLDIRLVAGLAHGFCQNDREKKRQLIVVMPARDASRWPDVNDLRRTFPSLSSGDRIQDPCDPHKMPIPYYDFVSLTGVTIEDVAIGDRQMTILYADRRPLDAVKIADSTLVGVQLRADELDEMLWPTDPQNYHIVGHEAFRSVGKHNLLLLVRSGAEVAFSPALTVQTEVTGRGYAVFDRRPLSAEIH